MTENGMVRGITARQQRAITALLGAPSVAQAAVDAGVGERTLHRWLKRDEAFRDALRQAQDQAMDAAVSRLVGAAPGAADVLAEIADDSAAPSSARVSAARAILESVQRFSDLRDVVARLAVLESRMGG